MRNKQIYSMSQMQDAISAGMTKIASTVARTLGPGGLPILLEREGIAPDGSPLVPLITKDGVTVAGECQDPDPATDLVIQSVKAICSKTNRVAGDGTTTAIVLGQSIFEESLALLKASPELNPQLLRESVESASQQVIAKLRESSVKVKDPAMIEAVATISANGDASIGKVIREAFERVGAEGVITVDEGHTNHTEIEVVEGYQIRRGAEAQDRFFNNSDRNKFEADNVAVIIYDGKLSNFTELVPALHAAVQAANPGLKENQTPVVPPIMVIANEFSTEVIQFLLIQRAQAGMSVIAVKGPHTTNVRTSMLDDLAVALDGYRFGNGNRNLQSAKAADVGFANKAVVDKYTTTFYDGAGSEESVLNRVGQLKSARASAESPYDAALISDRIAALSNGIAKIGVGGATDFEIKERYHRIEDALNAARAAVEEGVVPGGGTALLRIAENLGQRKDSKVTVGERVLAKALKAPFNQIVENIGEDPGLAYSKLKNFGATPTAVYDARERKVRDSFEAGILDPVKVVRSALENATSISALLSTCGGGIAFERKE